MPSALEVWPMFVAKFAAVESNLCILSRLGESLAWRPYWVVLHRNVFCKKRRDGLFGLFGG